ncbi:MAG: c-type cytochrome [Anaerolineae bacterium]
MIKRSLRPFAWISLGVLVGLLVFAARPTAHALPEYAARTGQPCATCHVNPAGGGPRTMRGSLWLAQGKPDQVPALPGGEEQAGAATLDGQALFEKFACSGCHGPKGEGGVGPALNQAEAPADEITQVIRNGQGAMMPYKADTLSDTELEAIIQYVQALGRGEVEAGPVLETRPLPPAQLTCGDPSGHGGRADCGGN